MRMSERIVSCHERTAIATSELAMTTMFERIDVATPIPDVTRIVNPTIPTWSLYGRKSRATRLTMRPGSSRRRRLRETPNRLGAVRHAVLEDRAPERLEVVGLARPVNAEK